MRRTLAVIAAVTLGFAVLATTGGAATSSPSPTPGPDPNTISATTSPVGPTLNAIGPHYMQDNPTRPVPANLAAQGFHELNKGDALPAGVVWADPNVIWRGPNSPHVGGDPGAPSGPVNAIDWAPTACSNRTNVNDQIYTPVIWAVGSEANIRTENPWGYCTGAYDDAFAGTEITATSGFGTAVAESGADWTSTFSSGPGLPFWRWKALNVGDDGFYQLPLNAGDTYNYWVQTVNTGAYGCPPNPNYQRCTQIGVGYVPMLATATLDLLNGAWGSFRSVNGAANAFAESSLQGGASNPMIFGAPQVQNPDSRQFVGLNPGDWTVFMNHPYTSDVNALSTFNVWEVWQY